MSKVCDGNISEVPRFTIDLDTHKIEKEKYVDIPPKKNRTQ